MASSSAFWLALPLLLLVQHATFGEGSTAPTIESNSADEIVFTAENVLFAGGLNTDLAGILMDIKGKATPDSVAAAIEKGVAAVVSDMSDLSTRLTESETKVSYGNTYLVKVGR